MVVELLKSQYDCLFGIPCAELKKKEVLNKLFELDAFMTGYYDKVRKSVKETELMGRQTYG